MVITYTYSIVTVCYTVASHVSLLKSVEDINKTTVRNSNLQWGKTTLQFCISFISVCSQDSWSGMCLA